MKIHTLWGERRGFESDTPELMVAWDENSVDENWDGWDEACKMAIQSWGEELVAPRYIDIDVPGEEIFQPFEVSTVKGSA